MFLEENLKNCLQLKRILSKTLVEPYICIDFLSCLSLSVLKIQIRHKNKSCPKKIKLFIFQHLVNTRSTLVDQFADVLSISKELGIARNASPRVHFTDIACAPLKGTITCKTSIFCS